MKIFRLTYRASIMIGCLVFHIVWVVVPGFFRGRDLKHALNTSQLWLGWVIKKMGVRVSRNAAPPPGVHIFVGNHRSYLDGILAMSHVQSLPVVKAEMSEWPLIGYGAKLTGVIFVKRESKDSRTATLDSMKKALDAGFPIVIYPEGTTHDEPTTIEIRPGSFNLAAKNGYSIVPMAIEYEDINDYWIGDEGFVSHFIRYFGKKRRHVKLRYGEPIKSDNVQYLLDTSKQWIDENMLQIRREFELEKTSKAV